MLKFLKAFRRCIWPSNIALSFSQLQKIRKSTNPYMHIGTDALKELAQKGELSVNQMIELSEALKNHNIMLPQLYDVIKKHLAATQFCLIGTFFGTYHNANNLSSHELSLYLNTVALQPTTFDEELRMAELLHARSKKFEDQTEQYIFQKSKWVNQNRLLQHYVHLDFRQLIQYMRFCDVSREEIEKKIDMTGLKKEEAILAMYLCKNKGIGLEVEMPDEEFGYVVDPKTICMLCQLVDQERRQKISQKLDFANWTYRDIVWISQFLTKDKMEQAHRHLVDRCQLQDPSTLMLYLSRLPSYLHDSLCLWLLKQEKYLYETFEIQQLLDLLNDLPFDSFLPYLEMLMKEARGKFTWQHVNQLYYFGKKWKSQSQDVEALRIYVVTGYNSLGVNRRLIPTSSYFYKIIEMVPPEELYKFKVDFGDVRR